jgi:hypothetical protein
MDFPVLKFCCRIFTRIKYDWLIIYLKSAPFNIGKLALPYKTNTSFGKYGNTMYKRNADRDKKNIITSFAWPIAGRDKNMVTPGTLVCDINYRWRGQLGI